MQHDRTPPRTVAVLSDIHGVLPALDAVLAEPDVVAADRLVLTGDIATGPAGRGAVIVATGYPDAATWADFFIRSPASDAEALTTFSARDHRFDDTADLAQPHDFQDRS